jgi:AcrR family transcriptional regulator
VHGSDKPGYLAAVSEAEDRGEEGPVGLPRLPPGRHGLGRDFVTENQRGRLTAGIIAVVAERGYHEATVTQICAAAGVSRRTFYGYFSSKEECYLATYDLIAAHLRVAVAEAAAPHEGWTARARAKLATLLEIFAANPDLARFYLVAPPRAGEQIAERYHVAVGRALAEFTERMPPPPATREVSEAAEQALVGGVATLIVQKVEAGEGEALSELLPDLVELTLTPYLGREKAVRVARSA